jgi:hypothetical protein
MHYPPSRYASVENCLPPRRRNDGPYPLPTSYSLSSPGVQTHSLPIRETDGQELLEQLFGSQVILTSQFFNKRALFSGEKRLLLAMLVDAINCYLSADKTDFKEAIFWFTNSYQNARKSFTSFHFICEIFNIDPHRFWTNLGKLKCQRTYEMPRTVKMKRLSKKWRKVGL